MVAANEIAVRGDERVLPDLDACRGKQLAVEADVGAIGEDDVPVLAREDRIAADEDAAADRDAGVVLALGVEQAVIVDDDVVADADLVRMPQHDALTEDDVSPTGAEEHAIQPLAQHEAERAR